MKKFLFAAALTLLPSLVGAQSIGPYQTPTGGWDVPTNTTAGTINDSSLTSGNCVQASTAGLLATTGSACASAALPVSSYQNGSILGGLHEETFNNIQPGAAPPHSWSVSFGAAYSVAPTCVGEYTGPSSTAANLYAMTTTTSGSSGDAILGSVVNTFSLLCSGF